MTDYDPPAVVPTWATVDDVTDALGVPPSTAGDVAHLERCVDAANAFGYRRRQSAGYRDDPAVTPGPDATLGVVTYAVALYRERATVDSFPSFEGFATGAIPPSTFGQVLRLLGIPRPQTDTVTAEEVAAYRARRARRARVALR